MKNLLKFVYIIALAISSISFGQDYINKNAKELLTSAKEGGSTDRRKILCVTYSCCGIGSFGAEIWSHTACDYITTGKNKLVVMDVKDTRGNLYEKDEVEVLHDIALTDENKILEEGQGYIMKAGLYKVINGQIAFEPSVERIRYVCYTSEHQGHVFGHEYSYSLSQCFVYPWFNKSGDTKGALATIDISGNDNLVKLAKENKNTLRFDDDTVVNENIIIKAGEYFVNENNKIYTREFYIK